MRVACNNLASTVLSAFSAVVDQFGLPSRIRIDRGGGNICVSEYMLERPKIEPGKRSVIAGRSVYNQKDRKTLEDLYARYVCFFYQTVGGS